MIYKLFQAICILAFCCPLAFSQNKSRQELQKQIQEYATAARGKVGVMAKLLDTGETIGLMEDQPFPMQSVYKFPIGMAVLHQVDQGRLKLDQEVKVGKAEYVRQGQHSPMRDQHPNGTTLRLDELLRLAVSESDGSASDVLLRLAGGPAPVMAYLKELGVSDLMVVNTEKEIGQKHSVQYDNWAKPAAAVALLEKLHAGKGISGSSRSLLLRWMTETPTGPNRIKGRLPKGTVVVHKTGASGTQNGIAAATNDIGLVTLPGGRTVAIAIFVSDSAAETGVREEAMANITRAVWDYWTGTTH